MVSVRRINSVKGVALPFFLLFFLAAAAFQTAISLLKGWEKKSLFIQNLRRGERAF